ncbi:MAG: hypothetical protein V3U65_12180 [Granulosicoccaceae bacterium]
MQKLIKRTLSACLTIVLAITQTSFSPAMAQNTPDIQSPIIEIEAVVEADAGNTQVFTALVADDRLLKDVTLYHRRAGRQAFDRAVMLPRGIAGYYSVELATDPADLRSIEYYVQARDQGGNRSISGFAFDPYQRMINANNTQAEPLAELTTATEPVARATATPIDVAPKPEKKSSNTKWWAIGLAVVVGAVVASSGGSSSDGPARTDLTINLPLPQ